MLFLEVCAGFLDMWLGQHPALGWNLGGSVKKDKTIVITCWLSLVMLKSISEDLNFTNFPRDCPQTLLWQAISQIAFSKILYLSHLLCSFLSWPLNFPTSLESIWINSQGSQGSRKTWKGLEFYYGIFQGWKVLEGYWSWKVVNNWRIINPFTPSSD